MFKIYKSQKNKGKLKLLLIWGLFLLQTSVIWPSISDWWRGTVTDTGLSNWSSIMAEVAF